MDIPSKKIQRFRYLCYGASLLIFVVLFRVPIPQIADSRIMWGAPLLPRTGQHGTLLTDNMGMIMMLAMIAILYCLTVLAVTYYQNKTYYNLRKILEVNLDAKQYENRIRVNYHYIHRIKKRSSPIEKISSQLFLAQACNESGKFDEAEALLQDSSLFIQQPNKPEYTIQNIYKCNLLMELHSRGIQGVKQGQFVTAYEELKKIGTRADLKPYVRNIYDAYLESAERMKKWVDGHFDELIVFYENEINNNSKISNIQKIHYIYNLAKIHHRLGNDQKAMEYFRIVAKEGNTLYIAQEARKIDGENRSQPEAIQVPIESQGCLNKMTEYQCFKDYNSFKLKNSICFTDKQRERRAALIDKCQLLSPEVSYFTPGNHLMVRQAFAISILLYMIAIFLLFFHFTIIQMDPNVALIVILLLLLTIPMQKNLAMPFLYKSVMKKIRQMDELITQFEILSFESGEMGYFDKVIQFLEQDSQAYEELVEKITERHKQEQKYRFQSFSIDEIFWGDAKKGEVIVEGTVTADAEVKEGTFHERKWKRRYTIIHKKGVVRISDMEDLQMR
jgi:hypothetical protein